MLIIETIKWAVWVAPLYCVLETYLLGNGRPYLGIFQIGHYIVPQE